MGFFGSSFHSRDFSTHEDQCGSCGRSTVSDRRLDCYCSKYRSTYPLNGKKCSYYVKDNSRDYSFWEKIYTYYILTAIFDILHMDKSNVIYQKIRGLIDNVRCDNEKAKEAIGYDAFGPDLANRLRMDPDRENICNFLLMEYLVKIYCAIGFNKMDEAVEIYQNMVEYLFIRYRNIDNYAELIDVKKIDNSKVLSK